MRFDPAQAAAMPQWKKTKLIDSPTIRRGGASPAKKSSSSSSSSTSSASSGAAAAVVVERPLSPPVQRSVVTRPPPARLSAAALKRKGLVDRLPSVGDELEEVEFEADKGNEVEQLEVVAESELREYHMKYGLDFGKMAPKGDRKMVGLLQRQYYSRPIACREEELSYQDEVAAEWSLVDDALVKVENQCRYYSEIKVAYRGRQWDISPDSDLIPMIHAPDVPETTFPVKVVDIYVDPNGFAMLSFKWFYRKHEIKRASGKRAKKSIAFYEEEKDEEVAEGGRRRRGVEVAVGTAVFSTPIEFVRDASLVAYGNTLLHSPLAKNADFYCRREYDDQTHVLRPLLV